MNEKCVSLTTRECQCKDGFSPNIFDDCVDIDECALASHSCFNNSECINTEGSFECVGELKAIRSTIPTTTTSTVTTSATATSSVTLLTSTAKTSPLTTAETNNKTTLLVLSSYDGSPKVIRWKPAMLINSAGEQKTLTCFGRDIKTEAEFSCSLNWQNQLFIFGGNTEKRQISTLIGYKLKRVGDLAFDLRFGACSVMNNHYIYLCFNYVTNDRRRCRRSTGPLKTFSEVALSTHIHNRIKISCSDSKSIDLASFPEKMK